MVERIKLAIIWQLPEQEGEGGEYGCPGKSTPMGILFKEQWVWGGICVLASVVLLF